MARHPSLASLILQATVNAMQVIAILRTAPTTTRAHLEPLVKPEAKAVWAMHRNGTLRSAQFIQAPGTAHPDGVTLMLEVDSLAMAEELIAALPMVEEGLVSTQVLPLAPFSAYEALFANAPAAG